MLKYSFFCRMETPSVKVLVIRFSSIGDVVLTTPVIRCIHDQLDGNVEIDFLTKVQYAPILETNPYLTDIITIRKKVSEAAPLFREKHYDFVVDLHNNLRSRQAKQKVKALAFTLDKRNIAKWLYVTFKKEILPVGHVVERSLATVSALGIRDDGKGLDYFIPEKDQVDVNVFPETFRNGFIAYAIGGKFQGKILPTEKIIALCSKARKPIVLLGGPEDAERGGHIESMCKNTFNACGKFSLHQSASILQQSEAVIAHDTGLMHIAAALKKKVVSLWFATTPEIGMSPWRPGEGSVMVEANCKKRPTSKLGNRGYEDGCVFNIDLERIVEVL